MGGLSTRGCSGIMGIRKPPSPIPMQTMLKTEKKRVLVSGSQAFFDAVSREKCLDYEVVQTEYSTFKLRCWGNTEAQRQRSFVGDSIHSRWRFLCTSTHGS